MAKILVVDGCEKAGKSTFIARFRAELNKLGLLTRIRKQSGAAIPDWSQYVSDLAEDLLDDNADLVIWDRSWLSEIVYAMLVDGREIPNVPHAFAVIDELSEYMAKIVLLGPDVETLTSMRDSTDMPVDVAKERELFRVYGNEDGWLVIANHHSDESYAGLSVVGKEELSRLGFNLD